MSKRTALGIMLLLALPAHAQIPVTCTSCPTEWQDRLRWVNDQAQNLKILNQGIATVNQLQSQYRAITGVRDMGSAVYALQTLGIQLPVPVNPNAIMGLLHGTGGMQGMGYNLQALLGPATTNLKVYDCTSGNVVCEIQKQQRNGAAGAQAVAMGLYQASGRRQQEAARLQAQLAGATDPAQRDQLRNQLLAVQAQATDQALQAQTVHIQADMEQRMAATRQDEALQQQIDGVISQGKAKGLF